MLSIEKNPAPLSLFRAARDFRVRSESRSTIAKATFERRVNQVTRDEITTLFRLELGYGAQA